MLRLQVDRAPAVQPNACLKAKAKMVQIKTGG